jgi:hypothetical protein
MSGNGSWRSRVFQHFNDLSESGNPNAANALMATLLVDEQ